MGTLVQCLSSVFIWRCSFYDCYAAYIVFLGKGPGLALFDMPNSNRFNILSISILYEISLSISISIFSRTALSILISILIFSKISLLISISISIYSRTSLTISIFSRIALLIFIFLEWRYRYFQNLPIYRLSIKYWYWHSYNRNLVFFISVFDICI